MYIHLKPYLLSDPMEQFIIFSGDYNEALFNSDLFFTAAAVPFGNTVFNSLTLATAFVIFLSSSFSRFRWLYIIRAFSVFMRRMTRKVVTNTTFAPFSFMLSSIYLGAWLSNFIGLLPYSPTPTASITGPATYVFACLFSAYFYAIILHKWAIFRAMFPKSTPLYLMWLIISIEAVSFLAKSISLIVRLFANMLAGHALIKIIVASLWGLFISSFGTGLGLAISSLTEPLFLSLFYLELIIAFLQAYVFLTMTSLYIAEVIHLDH